MPANKQIVKFEDKRSGKKDTRRKSGCVKKKGYRNKKSKERNNCRHSVIFLKEVYMG